jgi:hypothetical protein
VHALHRLARAGMLVRQSGHSRTVGSSAVGFLTARFTALITRNSARTTSRKFTSALRNAPYRITASLTETVSWLRSGWPIAAAIRFISTSLTREAMTAPKAMPRMTATASSTTFPRNANSLNSFHMRRLLPQIRSSGGVWFPQRLRGRRSVCGAPTNR